MLKRQFKIIRYSFQNKTYKKESKTPNQHLKSLQANEKSKSKLCLTNLQLFLPPLTHMLLALLTI